MKKFLFAAAVLSVLGSAPAAAQMQRMDGTAFKAMAMSSDAFEINSSRMALERSNSSGRVQNFANRMINDHSMTTAALSGQGSTALGPVGTVLFLPVTAPAAILGGAVGAPPAGLAAHHAAMLNQLSMAQGRQFDRMYKRMQVQAHHEAVALYANYARTGDNPALADFAQQTLPHLRHHLAHAQRL